MHVRTICHILSSVYGVNFHFMMNHRAVFLKFLTASQFAAFIQPLQIRFIDYEWMIVNTVSCCPDDGPVNIALSHVLSKLLRNVLFQNGTNREFKMMRSNWQKQFWNRQKESLIKIESLNKLIEILFITKR